VSLAPGSRLGSFEVVSKLGAGGMGAVWRTADTRLGRQLALKLLPEVPLQPPETNNSRFTVNGGASRLLAIEPVAALSRPPLTVVVSWPARLTR
jgi:serine/threonine protein kinase